MIGLRLAWAFLTRLPGGTHPEGDLGLGRAVPWFPVVGALVGLLSGGVYLASSELIDPLPAAVLAVAAGAVFTGAFHEDGLADLADSLGGYTRERRLEIMHDSRVGTFGVLALIVAFSLKAVSLASFRGSDGLLALVLAHAVGRAAAVGALLSVPPARGEGLGSGYAAGVDRRAAWALVLITFAALAEGGPAGAVAAGLTVVGAAGVALLARRAVGGTTGDVLGAIEQVAEIAVLVGLARLVPEQGWSWS